MMTVKPNLRPIESPGKLASVYPTLRPLEVKSKIQTKKRYQAPKKSMSLIMDINGKF
jgi:hypothetical protein